MLYCLVSSIVWIISELANTCRTVGENGLEVLDVIKKGNNVKSFYISTRFMTKLYYK